MNKRVVNINYKCDGLSFDASIDCDNALKKTLGKEYLPNEVGECRTNIVAPCDAIYMLSDWRDSPGATSEHAYAKACQKEIIYENEQ
jgi:hypothetical protein